MNSNNNLHHSEHGTVTLGWREWGALPDLGLPAIKAKVDTGAKTSALHAFNVERIQRAGIDYARFSMHPLQYNRSLVIDCESPLVDERMVSDSGGHREQRYVIETTLVLGRITMPVEITLVNRDNMRFRMLLGRRAMEGQVLVDPSASYLCGKLNYRTLYNLPPVRRRQRTKQIQ